MKRFNIDEFIWFLTLALLTWIMIYFIRSERISYFINADMIKYFYVSIGILIVFSIFQLRNIFTPRVRTDIANKFLPLIFTIIICVFFLYVMPLMKNYNERDALRDKNIDDINVLNISSDNYKVLSEIESTKEIYNGKKIYMLGFIKRDKFLSEDEWYLSRDVISCCQNDKTTVRIRVKGLDDKYKEGMWVKILGTIQYDDGWYVESLTSEETNEPYDIFFHES